MDAPGDSATLFQKETTHADRNLLPLNMHFNILPKIEATLKGKDLIAEGENPFL